ncbi:hypothetical protein [Anaerotignum sp.]|nr:hypothetical protein [Anaerotignum sp.]
MELLEQENRIWGVHTKQDDLFLGQNIVAIGWEETGDLSDILDYSQ